MDDDPNPRRLGSLGDQLGQALLGIGAVSHLLSNVEYALPRAVTVTRPDAGAGAHSEGVGAEAYQRL